MKSVFLPLGVLVLLVSIPISMGVYSDYMVFTEGELVKVEVINIRYGTGKRDKTITTFRLNNHTYREQLKFERPYQIGDTMTLKYHKDYDGIFLSEHENPILISTLVLSMLLGTVLGCFYYYFKGH